MHGMNRHTGKSLSGIAHLRQSITDILTTPIGSRLMQRSYGSRLYTLVDKPLNPQTLVEIYIATAEALNRWEKRFKLTQVQVKQITPGQIALHLTGHYQSKHQPLTLTDITL